MTDHDRNVRDISWQMTHGGIIHAVDLAYSRGDIKALKKVVGLAYGVPHMFKREWEIAVKPRLKWLSTKDIETGADYEAALAYLETLMDAEPDSSEEAELEAVSLIVDEYEQVHHPIGPPDPAEAIKFRREQEGA